MDTNNNMLIPIIISMHCIIHTTAPRNMKFQEVNIYDQSAKIATLEKNEAPDQSHRPAYQQRQIGVGKSTDHGEKIIFKQYAYIFLEYIANKVYKMT